MTGNDRRVVITGLGVMAPGAVGTKAYWELLSSGRTAVAKDALTRASRGWP